MLENRGFSELHKNITIIKAPGRLHTRLCAGLVRRTHRWLPMWFRVKAEARAVLGDGV